MSPDAERILEAIESIQGHTIVPDNLEMTVYHFLSQLGSEVIRDCAGKSFDYKVGYLEGWCRSHKGRK